MKGTCASCRSVQTARAYDWFGIASADGGGWLFRKPHASLLFLFSICLFEPVHPRLPVNSGPEPLMSQDRNKDLFTHDDYTMGWVCALPKELTAATAMLDHQHRPLSKPRNDINSYTLGSIGPHNIAITCLPKGMIGNVPAATVASHLVTTFPSIKAGLMVGIGGGVPSNKVRLGDVVVGTSSGDYPGVVKWDAGKVHRQGKFERTGSLNNPPQSLLTALTQLETQHNLVGSKIPEYLEELKDKWPKLAATSLRSESLKDISFKSSYDHLENTASNTDDEDLDGDEDEEQGPCRFCDRSMIVKRKYREMRIFFGLIASGDKLIKDATSRNTLNRDLGGRVLCIEMEAAGLVNHFPCLVIRGICDYADSHKNKDWQEHAAIVAAAFAKELLQYVQRNDVKGERPLKDLLNDGKIRIFSASYYQLILTSLLYCLRNTRRCRQDQNQSEQEG